MPFELKTEFKDLDEAIAYLQSDVADELKRLQTVETEAEAEKTSAARKRCYRRN